MDTNEKYKKLLKNQVKKLDVDEGFDFEAWKSSALVILAKIFGPNDMKVKHISEMRIDHGSSWSMRAVSGDFNPVESAKKQCREILNVALDEIEVMGDDILSPGRKALEEALGNKLTANSLKNILTLEKEGDEGVKEVAGILKGLKISDLHQIIFEIVTKVQ